MYPIRYYDIYRDTSNPFNLRMKMVLESMEQPGKRLGNGGEDTRKEEPRVLKINPKLQRLSLTKQRKMLRIG